MRKLGRKEYLGACIVAGVLGLSLAGCQSSSSSSAAAPAASTPAAAASSAPAAAPAATTASDVQVCNDVNTWESGNEGLAATFGTDAQSGAIGTEASGSSAVDTDVQSLSGDTGTATATDLSSVASDCAAAGVTLTGTDFSQAAAPATTPAAPAMSAAEQQTVTSAQGYLADGQGFSQSGLLTQLTSSYGAGFTEAQAEYAISKTDA